MIFVQQMQYNAPNRMYVFQKCSGGGGDNPKPPFGAGRKIELPPCQILVVRLKHCLSGKTLSEDTI